jgi:FkbM family methyltransferase
VKQNILVIYSKSIGDTLCATPTLRKLCHIYNSRFDVATYVPEIFHDNPLVLDIIDLNKNSENEFERKYNVFKTFHNMGKRNKEGIELKGAITDIRQIHAIDLGFTLLPEEMYCEFHPNLFSGFMNDIHLPQEYICIHPVQTWPSRSWSKDNWLKIVEALNELGIAVVSIGKDSSETGFFNIDKPAFHIEHKNNIDLINKLSLSQAWHTISRAKLFITMDSGLLHLAGTTDTHIIMLGSSIHPKFRMPYRNDTQDYKMSYVKGPCDIFCASNMKYSLKEWGSIQSVPPLIGCLENKSTFECHPSVLSVINEVKNVLNITQTIVERKESNIIEFLDFSQDGMVLNFDYKGIEPTDVDAYIKDDYTGLTYYYSGMQLVPNCRYYIGLNYVPFNNRRFEIYDLNNVLLAKYIETGRTIISDPKKILTNLSSNPKDETGFPVTEILNGGSEYYSDECHLEENDVVVDLGANIGLFTLHALNQGCKKCYSIESHPLTFQYLQKNLNKYNNCVPINVAISHTAGTVYVPKVLHGSPGTRIFEQSKDDYIETPAITFSDLCKSHNINHIDYLKIDIEGSEYRLFKNIDKEFLKSKVRKIAIELHVIENEDSQFILDILTECGFKYTINKKSFSSGLYGTLLGWKPIQSVDKKQEKILFITPHLSTGGLPQYLLKSVELLKNKFDVYVVEYENLTAGIFTVQKNKIISILPSSNFITLGPDKNELINIINRIQPNIIHFEEFPEIFMSTELTKRIYVNPNRTYRIVETTHNSAFKSSDKVFLPDKFYLVCKDSVEKFSDLNVPIELSEYPVEKKIRPNRKEALEKLGLDPAYKHILNVGLFTAGKNQSEIFEYAKMMLDEKVKFHFVGNQAGNFQDYWAPLMKNKPDNCIVWGEKDNVEDFYAACDLFLFTSLSELNPVVLKEALSWQMPILMYNLPIYHDSYDLTSGVKYLTKDFNKNLSMIMKNLDLRKVLPKEAYVTFVTKNYADIVKGTAESVSRFSSRPLIIYSINFDLLLDIPNIIVKRMDIDIKDPPFVNMTEGNFYVLRHYIDTYMTLTQKASIILDAIQNGVENGIFIDGDVIIKKNTDEIFDYARRCNKYPMASKSLYEYMIYNGKGIVTNEQGIYEYLDRALELPLMKLLNVPERSMWYSQTAVIAFNSNCFDFIKEWKLLCSDERIIKNFEELAPYHDETIFNVLLWKYGSKDQLPQTVYNVMTSNDVDEFYKETRTNYKVSQWKIIPENKNDIKVFHGCKNLDSIKLMIELIDTNEQISVKIESPYKIKLVHLLNFPHDSIEVQSIKSLSDLSKLGIQYIQHVNPVATELPTEPPLYSTQQGGGQLLPGHYGCFSAFRRAIVEEFTDDVDFLLICERDCILTVKPIEFYSKIMEYCPVILKEDISYFSFGDKIDIETGILQSEIKRKLEETDEIYITNKIIGLQSIMFPKSSRAFLLDRFKSVPWYGMDIWFNHVFLEELLPMGIVSKRLTTQLNGYSLVEKRYKEFV